MGQCQHCTVKHRGMAHCKCYTLKHNSMVQNEYYTFKHSGLSQWEFCTLKHRDLPNVNTAKRSIGTCRTVHTAFKHMRQTTRNTSQSTEGSLHVSNGYLNKRVSTCVNTTHSNTEVCLNVNHTHSNQRVLLKWEQRTVEYWVFQCEYYTVIQKFTKSRVAYSNMKTIPSNRQVCRLLVCSGSVVCPSVCVTSILLEKGPH
jgi:hypothetical protein